MNKRFLLGGFKNGDLKFFMLMMTLSILAISVVSFLLPGIKHGLEGTQLRPVMHHLLTQGKHYLNLIIFINWVLASTTVFQAARHFAARQVNTVAILRCFGADFSWIMKRFFLEAALLSALGGVLGFLLGILVAFLSRPYLEYWLQKPIEWNWLLPLGLSVLTAFILFLTFALPPLWALRKVTPLYIIRRAYAFEKTSLGMTGKIRRMLVHVLGGMGVGVRYGVASCMRTPTQSLVQIIVFALVMLCAWVLLLMKSNLLKIWATQEPLYGLNEVGMVSMLTIVVECFWSFTAVMALVLLWCSITMNQNERRHHVALFRALGASSKRILSIVLSEFIFLGFISGLLAALGASALLAWLSIYVFDWPYHFNWGLLGIGPVAGMVIIALFGGLTVRTILSTSPMRLLSAQ